MAGSVAMAEALFQEKEESVSEIVRLVLVAYEHLRVAITNRVAHKQVCEMLRTYQKLSAPAALARLMKESRILS